MTFSANRNVKSSRSKTLRGANLLAGGKSTVFSEVDKTKAEKLFIMLANLQSRHALLFSAHKSDLQGYVFTKTRPQTLAGSPDVESPCAVTAAPN